MQLTTDTTYLDGMVHRIATNVSKEDNSFLSLTLHIIFLQLNVFFSSA